MHIHRCMHTHTCTKDSLSRFPSLVYLHIGEEGSSCRMLSSDLDRHLDGSASPTTDPPKALMATVAAYGPWVMSPGLLPEPWLLLCKLLDS